MREADNLGEDHHQAIMQFVIAAALVRDMTKDPGAHQGTGSRDA